jgi:hypothetical protein
VRTTAPADEHATATPPGRAALPAERAFVVQLRADADLARGIVAGRIEHVVSGVAASFESIEQMVGCMRDAVARRADGSRGTTEEP